ncbi:MAG: hypothetical protein Q4P29_01455 [Tissierellia bacterium]|nr:hypothetical protein [Tissierellia bacterium]
MLDFHLLDVQYYSRLLAFATLIISAILNVILTDFVFKEKTPKNKALKLMFIIFSILPAILLFALSIGSFYKAIMTFLILSFALTIFQFYRLSKIDLKYALLCVVLYLNFILFGGFILYIVYL